MPSRSKKNAKSFPSYKRSRRKKSPSRIRPSKPSRNKSRHQEKKNIILVSRRQRSPKTREVSYVRKM